MRMCKKTASYDSRQGVDTFFFIFRRALQQLKNRLHSGTSSIFRD